MTARKAAPRGLLVGWKRRLCGDIFREALRVTPAAGADARHLIGLRDDVIHNRVASGRIAADAGGQPVQIERVPRPIRDVVIGA